MAPARDGMAPHLAAAGLADPRVPVVVNADARPVTTGEAARDALLRQIDGPVRWVESIEHMEREMGIDLFLEVGPGTVLTGMIKRIVSDAATLALGEPKNLDKLRELLAAG
jgi:[acyl-carrier-protein] S-malonyltransferase